MGWTRRSAAITLLLVTERQRREMGARAARRRDQLGLSNEKLARVAGLSTKTVSRFMNGKHEPRGHTFEAMTKALKLSEQELRGTPPAPLGLGESVSLDGHGAEQLDRIEQKLEEASEDRTGMLRLIEEQNELLAAQRDLLRSLDDRVQMLESAQALLEAVRAQVAGLQQPPRTQRGNGS